ncbi:MAG TPA: ABC transporter [Gammaproteobacteria bacterium]|nr:ABC transporter [Gammaproteobacteria bacterium]
MKVTPASRRLTRLQNAVFIVLLLAIVGVLAWLSTRYVYQADWTAGARRSLSEASVQMLAKLDGPLNITAFARDTLETRRGIGDFIKRYQRYKPDISLEFVDPDAAPARAREQGITMDGELVLSYGGQSERLKPFELREQSFTNALQRLLRSGTRTLVFLDGHGERQPDGQANFDLSTWTQALAKKGFRSLSLNLAQNPEIPPDTDVLVIAGPQVAILPGEVRRIVDYVQQGGRLLWLGEPGGNAGLEPLAEQLGIRFEPGVIVDLTSQLLGIQSPAIAAVTNYPAHPITRDFGLVTVFPVAAALGHSADEDAPWDIRPFLSTNAGSWAETGELAGELTFNDGADLRGPLDIGLALSRPLDNDADGGGEQGEQRAVVVGDGDFLANRYIGNAGNLDLGLRIVNWLSSDEALIDIPAKTAPDVSLSLSPAQSAVIGFGFLLGVPALLILSGLTVWLRRRRR